MGPLADRRTPAPDTGAEPAPTGEAALPTRRPALAQEPRWHAVAEALTEGVLYFMVVFSPWAFGTTQVWSKQVLNLAGFILGGLLALKLILRRVTGWRPAPGATEAFATDGTRRRPIAHWPTRLLAALTVLILGYGLVSLWNARATYVRSEGTFEYHDCLPWLPHTYDTHETAWVLQQYFALALMFWAVRDWLLAGANDPRGGGLPRRLQRLLWVVCINGALVGLEGLLQQVDGGGKLLWLVRPRINQEWSAQFGPYAYRSNAAQFFTLIWPVALGFWLTQLRVQRKAWKPSQTHHLLLPCVMLTAACPLLTLSRAGALVGGGGILLVLAILVFTELPLGRPAKAGLLLLLVLTSLLGFFVSWGKLTARFAEMDRDLTGGRQELWEVGWKMARENPVFGTGPGTLVPLYQLYRGSPEAYWPAQLHSDWLETLITFGVVGMGLILLALGVVVGRWFWPGPIRGPRSFVLLVWVALAGCLVHAVVDFPFQIGSIIFLFVLLCAVLFSLAKERGARIPD